MTWTLSRRDLLKAGFTSAVVGAAGLPGAGRGRRPGRPAGLVLGPWRVPLLRHRLRHPGGHQGRPGGGREGRPRLPGEPRPPLREGVRAAADPLRPGPPHPPAPAHEGREVRQAGRLHRGELEAGLRRDGGRVAPRPRRPRAHRRRHHGVGPVHHPGGVLGGEARQGGLALQQPRPQRAPLHGLGGHRVHADLRHRRAGRLLRRHRADRHGGAVGRQHGRDAPHALGAHRGPAAALARLPGLQHLHLLEHVVRRRRRRDRDEAEQRPRAVELRGARDREAGRGGRGLREGPLRVRHRLERHRLRHAGRRRAGLPGRARHPRPAAGHRADPRGGHRPAPPARRDGEAGARGAGGAALARLAPGLRARRWSPTTSTSWPRW